MQLIKVLMSFSKLLDYEFLEADNINNIQKCLNLIKNHDTELICNTTIVVFSHNCEDSFNHLSSHVVADIVDLIYWLIYSTH